MKNNPVRGELKLYAVVRADGTMVKIVTDEHSATRAMAEDLRNQISPEEFEAVSSCMMTRERSPEVDRVLRNFDSYKVELLCSRKLTREEQARLGAERKAEKQEAREEDPLDPRIQEIVKALAVVFGDLKVNEREAAQAMWLVFYFLAERHPTAKAAIVASFRHLADSIEAVPSERE